MLKEYIAKNRYKDNIIYIPYLFSEDRNVNGCTAIVKRVLGDKLKYSYQFSDYYIWEEKRYRGYGDSNYLIHAITEILGLVEHLPASKSKNEEVRASLNNFETKRSKLKLENIKWSTDFRYIDLLENWEGTETVPSYRVSLLDIRGGKMSIFMPPIIGILLVYLQSGYAEQPRK